MIFLYKTIFYTPLYNALVWIASVVPGGELGVAIIVLTLVVRFILLPLSHKMIKAQSKTRALDAKMKEVKERHKDNKEAQAQAIMALYKEHGINPFSSFFVAIIQFPILIALYQVFRDGLHSANAQLYPFVSMPEVINQHFLGFDLSTRSLILALLVGLSQFVQMHFSMPPTPVEEGKKSGQSLKDDFAKSMQFNMRYVLPVIIMIGAYSLPAALSLYWITNNLFMIGHEIIIRRRAQTVLETPTESTTA